MDEMKDFMRGALAPTKAVGEPVVVSPFAEWDYYYLREPIFWQPEPDHAESYQPVRVPKGFVTDLASIPRPFWSVLSPTAAYAYAAIIHDYLYWTQVCGRPTADEILRIGMEELRVASWKVYAIYNAVCIFGATAWQENAKKKQAGEKRFLREFPNRADIGWDEWRTKPEVFTDIPEP